MSRPPWCLSLAATEEKAGYVESSNEPAPTHTVDCADWNTDASAFFEVAEVSDVIRCLQAGADLEVRDRSGYTPLHWAARSGGGEAVAALIAADADPNARDNAGKLPVDYARDNEKLKGTDAYWKLNDARFK